MNSDGDNKRMWKGYAAVMMTCVLLGSVALLGCRSTPPPKPEPEPEPTTVEEPTESDDVERIQEEPDTEGRTAPAQSEEDVEAVDLDEFDEEESQGEAVAAHVDARIESALATADNGNIDRAIEDLTALVDEPEGGFLAAYNLGVLQDRQGNANAAVRRYVQALQRQPDFTPALTNLIRLYVRAGEITEANELANRFIDRRPDNLDHRAAQFEIWLHQDRYEDVIQAARDILRRDVEHVDAMILMATAKYELRRYELAQAILERALILSPERAESYYLLGEISWAEGDHDAARANFRQAIELQPRFPEARNNYAILLHDAGNFERAINHLEASLDDAPHNPDTYVNLGNSLKALGRYGQAEQTYRAALEIDEDHESAYFNLGILYLEAPVPDIEPIDRYEKAIESFVAFRDIVGQQEASNTPVANYINQASAAIDDEEERLEALRRAQMEDGGADDDPQEDEEEDDGDNDGD